MVKKVLEWLKWLMREEGGIGDGLMELTILGIGSAPIFRSIWTGLTSLADEIASRFMTTSIPE